MSSLQLQLPEGDILFLGETDIDIVNQAIIDINPKLVIIDSIQTMYSEEITAEDLPDSVNLSIYRRSFTYYEKF